MDSLGLSATSQQYFYLTTNQPSATRQQYFSLRTNQHQPYEQAEYLVLICFERKVLVTVMGEKEKYYLLMVDKLVVDMSSEQSLFLYAL
jgi:hypothetical protein